MLAELTASTPPNRTVTSSTERTGTSTSATTSSLSRDAGKVALLQLGHRGLRTHRRRRHRATTAAERCAQQLPRLRDVPAEPVGISADADRREAGHQVGQLRQLRHLLLQQWE